MDAEPILPIFHVVSIDTMLNNKTGQIKRAKNVMYKQPLTIKWILWGLFITELTILYHFFHQQLFIFYIAMRVSSVTQYCVFLSI